MQLFARVFARSRWLSFAIVVGMSTWATIGHLPKQKAGEPVYALEQSDEYIPTRSERVSDQFNLGRANAYLIVTWREDVFLRKNIRAMRALVNAVEDLDWVASVFWMDRIPNLNFFSLAQPLLPPDDAGEAAFAAAKPKLIDHPLIGGQLLSHEQADGSRALLLPITYDWLAIPTDKELTAGVEEAAEAALVKSLGLDEGEPAPFELRLTGWVPIFLAQKEANDRNQLLFQFIGYGMVLVLSLVLFRGPSAVMILAGGAGLGIFWALGIFQFFEVDLNSLTKPILPVLLAMIGFADGVHLMVTIRRARAAGKPPVEAAAEGLGRVGIACFLTSLTTAIGFFTLTFSEQEWIADFGWQCSAGVGLAFLAVVTFIPAMCSTWAGRNVHKGHEQDIIERWLSRYSAVLDRVLLHKRKVASFGIVFTGVCVYLAFTLRPDAHLQNTLPASSPAYQSFLYLDETFGGIQSANVDVLWDPKKHPEPAELLDVIRELESHIGGEPLLSAPLSVRDFARALPGANDDHETKIQLLPLLPPELRAYFYQSETGRARILIRVQDKGVARYDPVYRALEEELVAISERHPDFQLSLSGSPVRWWRSLHKTVLDLMSSLGWAALTIWLVLMLVYRSFSIGMISLLPNAFPLALTASLLVVWGESLQLVVVCAFVVCLGIAVDDTIHFLSRFRQEMRAQPDVETAVRTSFFGVGTALIMTTVVLVAGFSTVMLSDVPSHQTFAAMACATIASALIGDLIFLPALLAWVAPGRRRAKRDSEAESAV